MPEIAVTPSVVSLVADGGAGFVASGSPQRRWVTARSTILRRSIVQMQAQVMGQLQETSD